MTLYCRPSCVFLATGKVLRFPTRGSLIHSKAGTHAKNLTALIDCVTTDSKPSFTLAGYSRPNASYIHVRKFSFQLGTLSQQDTRMYDFYYKCYTVHQLVEN